MDSKELQEAYGVRTAQHKTGAALALVKALAETYGVDYKNLAGITINNDTSATFTYLVDYKTKEYRTETHPGFF